MKVEGKQMEYLKTFLLIAVIFLVFKLLSKFGLLGKSKDEKKADALFLAPQLQRNFNTTILTALKKKYKQSTFTNTELKALAPSEKLLKQWYENILQAKSFRDDNEALVFSTFKAMKNQMAVYTFGLYFNSVYGDLITFLKFLDSEELAKVSDIINSKPLV